MAVEQRAYTALVNSKITIGVSLAGFIVFDFFGPSYDGEVDDKFKDY